MTYFYLFFLSFMKLFLSALISLMLLACKEKRTDPYANKQGILPSRLAQIDTANYTLIQFRDSTISLGNIPAQDTVQVDFEFTNAGNTPLYIASVTPACGCTEVNYPKEPIQKGEEGKISARLATQNLVGQFEKVIGVVSNTRNSRMHSLVITGFAITDKKPIKTTK